MNKIASKDLYTYKNTQTTTYKKVTTWQRRWGLKRSEKFKGRVYAEHKVSTASNMEARMQKALLKDLGEQKL